MLKLKALPELTPEWKAQIALADHIANWGLRLKRGMFERLFSKALGLLDRK
jgi:hypothetical protein